MLQVMGSDGPSVVLATSTEEELAHWMAALCQAAIEEVQTLFHFVLSPFSIPFRSMFVAQYIHVL